MPLEPEEDVRFLGAGVTGRNQTLIHWKSSGCSQPLNSLQPRVSGIWFLLLLTTVTNSPEHGGSKQRTSAIVLQPQRPEVQDETHLPEIMALVGMVPPGGAGLDSKANPSNRRS